MNFFEHQEAARRNTGRLVLLFIAAVLSIIALVYLASLFILGSQIDDIGVLAIPLFFGVTAIVLVIVGGGSLYKTAQLSSGGSVVAEMLGATPVQREGADADTKKLLNVVEEMSIASGTPMPSVYVMEHEEGINAFAAGHDIDDAAVAVTRGTIKHLTRDELQGVIAHEFSHIFNGDMKLNMRLMGVLHGILLLGLIGGFILRGSYWGGVAVRRRRSKDGDAGQAILLFGLALTVIGYVGTFFGGLIKSAISRQREYLADASAVQFTRNPDGIGGALKKIGALTQGSIMLNPRAAEASHLFFGQGIKSALGGMTATHPPLVERIQRIDPQFDGNFDDIKPSKRSVEPEKQKPQRKPDAEALIAALAFIGAPSEQHVAYARRLVDGIPADLREAVRTPWGARAAVLALLLDSDEAVRTVQYDRLDKCASEDLATETCRLFESARSLALEARVPLLDLAMPSLRGLTLGQFQSFYAVLEELIRADRKLDLFEWSLTRVVRRHVAATFEPRKKKRVRFQTLVGLEESVATLLSHLAREGHDSDESAQAAFQKGAAVLGLRENIADPKALLGFDGLDRALDQLDLAAPAIKHDVLAACAATIAADHQVTIEESELFRGIADAIECPVPPLLAGQELAIA